MEAVFVEDRLFLWVGSAGFFGVVCTFGGCAAIFWAFCVLGVFAGFGRWCGLLVW